jgi:hypothetical protein
MPPLRLMNFFIDSSSGLVAAAYLNALALCLSEIKLAHTDDEVRQEMA